MASSRKMSPIGFVRKHQKLIVRIATCSAVAVLIASWLSLAMGLPPENHVLHGPSHASGKEIVAFEAAYYVYLAGLTIPTMGGLLVVLVTSHDSGKWRKAALTSMFAFSVAMIMVTIGYAIRVGWMNSSGGMPEWAIGFDKHFSGIVTAISYAVAIVGLLIVGINGPPPQKPRRWTSIGPTVRRYRRT